MTSTAEGWGMVLTEAQQMGVPIIAMDSFGALHDIIDDGINGRIVVNNNLNTFISVMKEVMNDDDVRHKMARNAVEGCKRFEIEKVLQRWVALFDELMQDK